MARTDFYALLTAEISRLDREGISKRQEKIVSGFSSSPSPRAIISGREYLVFNSNDYLGLRLHPQIIAAEHAAAEKFGSGPGAVRFISGSLEIHRRLESALAKFHHRDDAIIFSSAFAANLAAISSLIKGQSKDSLVGSDTLVVSDQLNHRSIVEGIRVANLQDTSRLVFPHFDHQALEKLLTENVGKFSRVLILTDGVFSMLGQFADLAGLRRLADKFDPQYPQGVLLYVDDCHGIGVLGRTGRGVEEICSARSDVLVGTLGKAFGTDGGYIVADQVIIDYLREAAATYIYSNSISPGTAGAALKSVSLLDSPPGRKLLSALHDRISEFKSLLAGTNFRLAVDSSHAIQPLLIGDALTAKKLQDYLFDHQILATSITYPVVPKGADEIRLQLSAVHTSADLSQLASALAGFSL
jgi:glycine C-acetyltransferase